MFLTTLFKSQFENNVFRYHENPVSNQRLINVSWWAIQLCLLRDCRVRISTRDRYYIYPLLCVMSPKLTLRYVRWSAPWNTVKNISLLIILRRHPGAQVKKYRTVTFASNPERSGARRNLNHVVSLIMPAVPSWSRPAEIYASQLVKYGENRRQWCP